MDTIGIVLAGGASRRMGRDKAMLDWHGQPLIEHQRAVLKASGVDAVCVSGRRPAYHGIADTLPDMGPVGGLASVAHEFDQDVQLLIVPVDMPLLTCSLLERLRISQPSAACLRYVDHVLPMRLHLNTTIRRCMDRLVSLREPRERSLRALQRAAGCVGLPLPADTREQFVDCNTVATFKEVAS